jgi:NADH dehydrogenase
MARFMPFLPLIGGGETKFQPVYVGDVAEAIARSIEGRARPGATYELGGPDVKTFKALMEYILEVTGRSRPLLPVPFPVARLQASVLELLPAPLLTVDQVRMLETDNVVSASAQAEKRTLPGFGISPATIESVVPSYLYRFRKHGQFERVEAHR